MAPEPDGSASPQAREAAPESSSEELPAEEEPTTTGTLFIMVLFLMALAGMWGIMYLTLLSR